MGSIRYVIGFCLFLVCGSVFGISSYERKVTLSAMVEKDFQALSPETRSWIEKQQVRIDQFDQAMAKVNCEKLLSKAHEASKRIEKPATYGLLPEHIGKNVHVGCVPYDETRALRHIEGFYISASDVLTPEQAYIVGEAPGGDTEAIFWRAMIEAHVQTVVALCTPDGDAYWDSDRFPKTIRRWRIEKVSEEEEGKSPFFFTHRIIRRGFRLFNLDTGESRFLTHLHYENWPDHDAPESSLFHKLLDLVDESNSDSSNPIFVHCAAGIGRSGTFVAAHSLRKEIKACKGRKNPHYINIAKRILELRIQRKKLLSKPTQLKAVIEAVRDAIHQNIGNIQ